MSSSSLNYMSVWRSDAKLTKWRVSANTFDEFRPTLLTSFGQTNKWTNMSLWQVSAKTCFWRDKHDDATLKQIGTVLQLGDLDPSIRLSIWRSVDQAIRRSVDPPILIRRSVDPTIQRSDDHDPTIWLSIQLSIRRSRSDDPTNSIWRSDDPTITIRWSDDLDPMIRWSRSVDPMIRLSSLGQNFWRVSAKRN